MKRIVLFVLCLLVVTAVCFGADVVVPVAPVVAVPVTSTFNNVLAWFLAHQVVLGALLIGILDFIFSINPQWKSNSVGHLFYLLAQKMSGTVEKESSVVTTTTPVAEPTT